MAFFSFVPQTHAGDLDAHQPSLQHTLDEGRHLLDQREAPEAKNQALLDDLEESWENLNESVRGGTEVLAEALRLQQAVEDLAEVDDWITDCAFQVDNLGLPESTGAEERARHRLAALEEGVPGQERAVGAARKIAKDPERSQELGPLEMTLQHTLEGVSESLEELKNALAKKLCDLDAARAYLKFNESCHELDEMILRKLALASADDCGENYEDWRTVMERWRPQLRAIDGEDRRVYLHASLR